MSLLYDTYVRFLVWLGAAPPPGYEHLLPPAKPKAALPPVKQASVSSAAPPPVKPEPVVPAPPPAPYPPRQRPLTAVEQALAEKRYRLLKSRVLGNEDTVKRLIEAERRRNPNANILVWLQYANDRWEHDNRW